MLAFHGVSRRVRRPLSSGYRTLRYRAESLEPRYLLAAINSGETLLDGFTAAGQTDDFTFNANVGDTIVFGATETTAGSPLSLRVQLLNPSSTVLANLTGAVGAGGIVTNIAAAGTYTVRVQNTAGTGNYAVSMVKAPGAQSFGAGEGTLASGEYRSGTITAGDIDVYQMSLSANTSLTAVLAESVGGAPTNFSMAIIGPSGQVLFSDTGGIGVVASLTTLPATGTYTFIVWDNAFDATGDYRLTAVTAPAAQVTDADSGPIASGVRRTGSIALGDIDVYTITAPANGNLLTSLAEVNPGMNFAPTVQVFSPTGARVVNQAGAVSRVDLVSPTVAGNYTIVVFDQFGDDVSDYALTAVVTPGSQPTDADSGPVTSGQYRTGTIDLGDIDVYTLAGTTGGSLVVRLADTLADGFDPGLIVTSPTGAVLFNSSDALVTGVALVNLPATGAYTISVFDSGGDETGAYALTAVAAPATQVTDADSGPLTSGVRRTGSLAMGDIDVYTVTAPSNGNLLISFGEINTPPPNFTTTIHVYSPTGARVIASSGAVGRSELVTATVSGTYTVVVYEQFGDDVGDYALTAVVAPNATQPTDPDSGPFGTSGTMKTGAIDIGDIDVYTISAPVGGTLGFNLADRNVDGFDPAILITSPNGTNLASTSDANALSGLYQNLAAGGTYTICVYDAGGDETGAYGLTVLVVPGAQIVDADSGPITSGVTRAGTLDLGDLDVYTIGVPVGSSLLVTVAESATGPANPGLVIYNPNGVVMRNAAAAVGTDWLIANVTVGGTYVIEVYEQFTDHVLDYRVTAVVGSGAQPTNEDSGPATPFGFRLGEIDHPADIDVFTVPVQAGEQLLVSVAESEYLGPGAFGELYVVIYGPNGNVIENTANNVGRISLTPAAPAAGTYTISVHEWGADETSVYGITIAPLRAAGVAPGGDLNGPPDSGPIASGQTLRGRIGFGDIDVYTFNATANQNVVIALGDADTSTAATGYLLVAPDGTVLHNVAGNFGVANSTATLPAAGAYKIVVFEQFGDETTEYALSVALAGPGVTQPNAGDSGPLTGGVSRAGAIGIGDIDVYTYNAPTTANFTVNFAETSLNGYDPRIVIYRPDGTRFADTSGNVTVSGVQVGTYTIVVLDNAGDEVGSYSIAVNAAAGADTLAPTITEAAYRYDVVSPVLAFYSSEDLGFSVQPTSFVLTNLTTGVTVPAASLALSYDSTTGRGIIAPSGLPNGRFPDARYRLTFPVGGVSDGSGNTLAAPFVYNFHVLAGDFNRDAAVGFDDLLILAQNYGKVGRPFSLGNADYDTSGTVGFDDLLLVAQNYGTTLALLEAPQRGVAFGEKPIKRTDRLAEAVL